MQDRPYVRHGDPDRDVDAPLGIAGELDPRDVVLGVRPEHLVPVAQDTVEPATRPLFRGVVRRVENLGGEEVAYCAVGDAEVAVRGPRPLGLCPDAPVTLTARPGNLHLFDAGSGRRLVWQAAPTTIPTGAPAPQLDVSTV